MPRTAGRYLICTAQMEMGLTATGVAAAMESFSRTGYSLGLWLRFPVHDGDRTDGCGAVRCLLPGSTARAMGRAAPADGAVAACLLRPHCRRVLRSFARLYAFSCI